MGEDYTDFEEPEEDVDNNESEYASPQHFVDWNYLVQQICKTAVQITILICCTCLVLKYK